MKRYAMESRSHVGKIKTQQIGKHEAELREKTEGVAKMKSKSRSRIYPKLQAWLKYYLSEGTASFFNASEAARAAGYRATSDESFRSIGYQNFTKLHGKIREWLEQTGLTDVALKAKLVALLEARTTHFERIRGTVTQDQLSEGIRVIVSTGQTTRCNNECKTDGESLLAIEVAALETQRRSLDMALKIKGIYSPERLEHSGAIATKLEISEEDRKLGQQLVQAAMATLMEAKRAKPA